jgi:hypothetical protein
MPISGWEERRDTNPVMSERSKPTNQNRTRRETVEAEFIKQWKKRPGAPGVNNKKERKYERLGE